MTLTLLAESLLRGVMSEKFVVDYLKQVANDAGLSADLATLCSRELAEKLNEADELKHLRSEFCVPKKGTLPEADKSLIDGDEDSIYLCGNSLGLMPKAAKTRADEQFEKWSEMGVFGHTHGPVPWALGDEECLEGMAKIVGADDLVEVGMMNGLTVNVHVLLTAFYKPTDSRHRILLESKAFPSDHYAIESQIRLKGRKVEESMICLEPREGEDHLREEDIVDYIGKHGDSIAVVFFSGVQYYTGQLFNMEKITKAGQAKGCLVGWDLAHAFANVPLYLSKWNVDFACWCTYKYGSSGAGGLAGIYINKRFADDERERMLGWWCHRHATRFRMDNIIDLDTGTYGYRISNPPIFLVTGILGFLDVYKKTSMEELRKKSLKLTGYLQFLTENELKKLTDKKVKCEIMTPRDPEQRGCQLSFKFNFDIAKVYSALVKRGIAVDKRYPYVIRVAPVHFYNNYTDVWRFVAALVDSIEELHSTA